jgi:hypothetical protein
MYRTSTDPAADAAPGRLVPPVATAVDGGGGRIVYPPELRLLAFLLTLAGILVTIAAVNLVVNPLGYYPVSLFRPLTWSTRQIKASLMAQSPPAEVLIMGSSRAMALAPSEIERHSGLRAFNASVDSARVEDYVAIFGYANRELGWKLRELVIGVDVESFHDNVRPDQRLATAPEFRRWLPLAQRTQVITGAIKDLVSQGQLHQSLRSIGLHLHGLPPVEVGFQPDGWNDAVAWEDKFARGLVHTDIEISLAEYRNRYEGFRHVDVARAGLFEELLAAAATQQIRVRAFLTPLHPVVIGRLRADRDFDRLRGAVVATVSTLMARYPKFVFRDYTEVESFGGSLDLFVDGAHIRKGNAERILAALYRD